MRSLILLVLGLLWNGCSTGAQLQIALAESIRHQQEGSEVKARAGYKGILRANATFAGPHNNLAVLDVKDQQLASALNHLEEELRNHPALPAARVNQLIVLAMQQRWTEVEANATNLAGSRPKLAVAHLMIGTALLRLGKDAERTESALAQALALGSKRVRAQAHFARGILRAGAKQWAASAADFKSASQLRRDAAAHYNLSIALVALDKLPDALREIQLATAIDRKAALLHHLEALILRTQAQPEKAREALQRALKLEPSYPGLQLLMGVLHYEERNFDPAHAAFVADTKAQPTAAASWFNLGLVSLELELLEAARDAFAKTAELDPSDLEASHNRDALIRLIGP